jgi:hypothetical protein
MTWLLLAGLGIIWAAFLLPSRRRSPAASVEEFEERMSLLAGANGSTTGRWVLMPRKGERFLGPLDRKRLRVRRRRRVVFTVLLDATGLTLLIGVFPPFRKVLILAIPLMVALMAYSLMLAKISADERDRARRRQRAARRLGDAHAGEREYAPYRAAVYATVGTNGNGHANGNGNGHANGNGNGHANGHANGNGHTNGNGHANGRTRPAAGRFAEYEPEFTEHGVRIVEDDVHVIVYRSDGIDLKATSAG